jgi:hypothetical protein
MLLVFLQLSANFYDRCVKSLKLFAALIANFVSEILQFVHVQMLLSIQSLIEQSNRGFEFICVLDQVWTRVIGRFNLIELIGKKTQICQTENIFEINIRVHLFAQVFLKFLNGFVSDFRKLVDSLSLIKLFEPQLVFLVESRSADRHTQGEQGAYCLYPGRCARRIENTTCQFVIKKTFHKTLFEETVHASIGALS